MGELGDAALAVYDTVQDPKSAIVNVMGMLVGAGAIARASRDGKGIRDVASIRSGMKPNEVAGLGDIFKRNDDRLQGIINLCKRA